MCPHGRTHWRHLANTIELVLRPTRVHNPNGKSIGSAVSAQLKADILYNGRPFSPKLPLLVGDLDPHLIHNSLSETEPTVQTASRSILIDSAVFAQVTAECPYTLQWDTLSPLKIAPSHGGSRPHLIHGSLDPPKSSTQTASRSVRPF